MCEIKSWHFQINLVRKTLIFESQVGEKLRPLIGYWRSIGRSLGTDRARSRVSEVRRGGSDAGANHPVIGNSQLNASMSNSAWKTKEGADPGCGAFQLSQIPQFASNRTSFEFPILASGLRGQHRFLLAKISLSYRHGKSFWKAIGWSVKVVWFFFLKIKKKKFVTTCDTVLMSFPIWCHT